MKILTIVALACSLLSIVISLWLVLSTPVARSHLASLEFPITGIGEAAFGMIIPLVLSAAATSLSLFTWKIQIGKVVGGIALVSWLVIWLVLGKQGFEYLFRQFRQPGGGFMDHFQKSCLTTGLRQTFVPPLYGRDSAAQPERYIGDW